MKAGAHIALGGAAWLLAAPWCGQPALGAVPLGLAALGALLPDIDHPASWVGRRTRPFSALVAALCGHRGLTHSTLAAAAAVWLLLAGGPAAPLAVGYLSHLAGDFLTPRGLPLAWPLKRRWALPLLRAGSALEPLLVGALLLLAVAVAIGPKQRAALARESGLCTLRGAPAALLCPPAPATGLVSPERG
jgi:inner membrane protein